MTTYAVTGANGGLGRATIEALTERGVAASDIVAIVRDADRAQHLSDAGVTVRVADYDDKAALSAVLSGVDRLLLVSGSEFGSRVRQHGNVIEAAKANGVDLLAYTSILYADTSPLKLAEEHLATEHILADSGVPHTLLRNGWYWENYVGSAPAAIESGTLYGSARAGRVAGAARRDYADAAAAVLIAGTVGAVYELAGSEPLDHPAIAAAIAEVSGKPVRYQDIPESAYAEALVGAGLPAPVAAILADSDAGVSRGALDSTSTDLADLRGRPSASLKQVLAESLVSAR
uniref:NmrA family NAD(P)-binding protein n=1 Tax=Gordonia sp. B7-2 TaxID=3420932 RepID=UPI003D92588B